MVHGDARFLYHRTAPSVLASTYVHAVAKIKPALQYKNKDGYFFPLLLGNLFYTCTTRQI